MEQTPARLEEVPEPSVKAALRLLRRCASAEGPGSTPSHCDSDSPSATAAWDSTLPESCEHSTVPRILGTVHDWSSGRVETKVSLTCLENKIRHTWWTGSWPAGSLSGPAAPDPYSSWPPPPPTHRWCWHWLPATGTSTWSTSWRGSRWRRPWAGGRRWGRLTAAPRSGQPGCAGTGCPPTRSAPGRGAGDACSSRTRPQGSDGWAKHSRSCPPSAGAGSGRWLAAAPCPSLSQNSSEETGYGELYCPSAWSKMPPWG